MLQAAKGCAAEFVGVKVEDIVHTTNATSAVNAVLLSTPLHPGDLILVTSISYGAVISLLPNENRVHRMSHENAWVHASPSQISAGRWNTNWCCR